MILLRRLYPIFSGTGKTPGRGLGSGLADSSAWAQAETVDPGWNTTQADRDRQLWECGTTLAELAGGRQHSTNMSRLLVSYSNGVPVRVPRCIQDLALLYYMC